MEFRCKTFGWNLVRELEAQNLWNFGMEFRYGTLAWNLGMELEHGIQGCNFGMKFRNGTWAQN